MKNVTDKQYKTGKSDFKKLDPESLKKVKGGQKPMHKNTAVRGKGAIS